MSDSKRNSYLSISNAPPVYNSVDELNSYFGQFGGCFVAETLMQAHHQLAEEYVRATQDPEFQQQLEQLGRDYVGRPTPLYHAKHLSEKVGGAQIWLKREDLAHTGAHKINNALGQAVLAQRLGKQRIIAETGAGQVRSSIYHAELSLQLNNSMASQQQQLALYLDWIALFTWVMKIPNVNLSTSFE